MGRIGRTPEDRLHLGAGAVIVLALAIVVGAWGFRILWTYQTRPGQQGSVPLAWVAESHIPRIPGRATVLLFAHPGCSCTEATVHELGSVMTDWTREGRQLPETVIVMAVAPHSAGQPLAVVQKAARDLPDTVWYWDTGRLEAKRFGVRTSGHILVYDASDRLTFSGGITAARGHSGANRGADALQASLSGSGRLPWRSCDLH